MCSPLRKAGAHEGRGMSASDMIGVHRVLVVFNTSCPLCFSLTLCTPICPFTFISLHSIHIIIMGKNPVTMANEFVDAIMLVKFFDYLRVLNYFYDFRLTCLMPYLTVR